MEQVPDPPLSQAEQGLVDSDYCPTCHYPLDKDERCRNGACPESVLRREE